MVVDDIAEATCENDDDENHEWYYGIMENILEPVFVC
jgi:hypothetical protein